MNILNPIQLRSFYIYACVCASLCETIKIFIIVHLSFTRADDSVQHCSQNSISAESRRNQSILKDTPRHHEFISNLHHPFSATINLSSNSLAAIQVWLNYFREQSQPI